MDVLKLRIKLVAAVGLLSGAAAFGGSVAAYKAHAAVMSDKVSTLEIKHSDLERLVQEDRERLIRIEVTVNRIDRKMGEP